MVLKGCGLELMGSKCKCNTGENRPPLKYYSGRSSPFFFRVAAASAAGQLGLAARVETRLLYRSRTALGRSAASKSASLGFSSVSDRTVLCITAASATWLRHGQIV